MKYKWKWKDEKPTKPGWYAVHYSWCSNEGSFMTESFFDGKKFDLDRPTFEYCGPFNDYDQCQKCVNESNSRQF